MKLSNNVKSVSYLKANASELLGRIADSGESLVITQNGEARAVLQDLATYERTQESLALLKLLAISAAHAEAGMTRSAGEAFERVRSQLQETR